MLFLASAAARFVTGVVLPVDGGYLDRLKESIPMIVQLPGIQPEIAIQAIPDDERVWVPQAPGVWFRPLLLNTVTGSWCNLLRVRKSGVLSRHIHPSWVTGYVISGAWRYLEHDWVAREGAFVYEPPGEIHTLVVDELAGADRDDHLLQHPRRDGLRRRGRRGHRLRGRVHQDRDVPQALCGVRARRGVRRRAGALTVAHGCCFLKVERVSTSRIPS